MPLYLIHIDREVITYDRFTRLVQANDESEARTKGAAMAEAANRDCPDDAGPSGHDTEFACWGVNEVRVADDEDIDLHDLPEDYEEPDEG